MLGRAHQLFSGAARLATPQTAAAHRELSLPVTALNIGEFPDRYRLAARTSQAALRSAAQTDAAIAEVIAAAHHDHAQAREQTKRIVDEARADAGASPLAPMAQREALRRRVAACVRNARMSCRHAGRRSAARRRCVSCGIWHCAGVHPRRMDFGCRPK
ncbi:hypothetical protein I553_8744 [Mycobacterium xenopi 4042]|uniref:Uncharacterized protein n=1 Tax=Mycobacterium xenopi 4042 TaxID=1299334 RepID=X8CN44_MYCXE|nr:hypothetical protein I553_8744 [Mycobacterium xenopi 4042]